jgi:glycosyltransferase involved in cell wall biosynthesis
MSVRVAFVSSHALPGGSERYLEMLLERLGEDWIAGVVSLQDGDLVRRLRAAGHRVGVVPAGARLGILPAAWRLRRALRAHRPQVVHANGVKAALVAGLAMAGTGVPVIWVKHDFSWDGSRLVGVTARLCHEVVGVSAAVCEALPGGTRTSVVANGLGAVDADAAEGRRALGDGEHVVLLGRLNRVKGALQLIEAVPFVLAQRPQARFTLIGGEDPNEPGYAAEVRAAIARRGLGDAVRLIGHHEDPLSLVAAASVAAVTSGPHGPGLRGEGFGLVALEAMAVGTPVVAYDAGAIPEVVGECGLVVAPGDPAALAGAIVRALADEDLRARLAACGQARVRERFTLEATVEAMRRRYSEAASGAS